MDCLEGMKDIPDKSIDMILCDLPYGTTACKWDVVIPFEPLWEQYNRVIKDNGAIVLFGSEPFSSYLRISNVKEFKYDWIWNKSPTGFLNAKKMPLKNTENISIFYKKLPTYKPQGLIDVNISCKNERPNRRVSTHNGGELSGVYKQTKSGYPKQILKYSNETGLHPTQKPIALMEYLIKTYTNEGETVLDNCMGSGTTAIACMNTNRNFIGFEKDKDIFNVAQKRIEDYKSQIQFKL